MKSLGFIRNERSGIAHIIVGVSQRSEGTTYKLACGGYVCSPLREYHIIKQKHPLPICLNCKKSIKTLDPNPPPKKSVFIMINNIDNEATVVKDLNDFIYQLHEYLGDDADVLEELNGKYCDYKFYQATEITVKPKTRSIEELIGLETEG